MLIMQRSGLWNGNCFSFNSTFAKDLQGAWHRARRRGFRDESDTFSSFKELISKPFMYYITC